MATNLNFTLRTSGAQQVSGAVNSVNATIEQVDVAAKKTTTSLAGMNKEAMKLGKGASNLGDAWDAVSSQFNAADGMWGKLMAGASAANGSFKALTGGVTQFGIVLKKLPRLLGPYIGFIMGIVAAVEKLWDKLQNPPELTRTQKILDETKDAVDRLTQSILKGNMAVSAGEALYNQAAEDAKTQWAKDYAQAAMMVKKLRVERAKAEADLREKMDAFKQTYQYEQLMYLAKTEGYLKVVPDLIRATELETGKEAKALEEINKLLADNITKLDKFNVEAAAGGVKQRMQMLTTGPEKKIKPVKPPKPPKPPKIDTSEMDRELAYLAELEKRWLHQLRDDQKHTHEELARIAVEEEKEAARKRIKNAENLQKALYLIEGRGAIEIKMAREKDEEEERKRIEAMEKRIADMEKKAEKVIGRQETFGVNKYEKEGEEAIRVFDRFSKEIDTIEREMERVREMREQIAKMPQEERERLFETEKELAEKEMRLTSDIYTRKVKFQTDFARARKKDNATRIKQEWDFSEATKAAIKANIQGIQSWQEAINLLDKDCVAVQVMQMTASGIQAGADAVMLNAEAMGAFAMGDIARGIGLEAAAAGKVAAVAAYIKGLTELGAGGKVSEPDTSKGTTSTPGTTYGALTGATEEHQTIDINLLYSWTDSQIANALIRGMNATAKTSGSARIDKRIIQG